MHECNVVQVINANYPQRVDDTHPNNEGTERKNDKNGKTRQPVPWEELLVKYNDNDDYEDELQVARKRGKQATKDKDAMDKKNKDIWNIELGERKKAAGLRAQGKEDFSVRFILFLLVLLILLLLLSLLSLSLFLV